MKMLCYDKIHAEILSLKGKKRMSDSKARFLLPPDDYEILRFGGESVKDEEKGIKQMMKYYRDFGLTEEQLRENNKKYNPEQMLQIVKEYFGIWTSHLGNKL